LTRRHEFSMGIVTECGTMYGCQSRRHLVLLCCVQKYNTTTIVLGVLNEYFFGLFVSNRAAKQSRWWCRRVTSGLLENPRGVTPRTVPYRTVPYRTPSLGKSSRHLLEGNPKAIAVAAVPHYYCLEPLPLFLLLPLPLALPLAATRISVICPFWGRTVPNRTTNRSPAWMPTGELYRHSRPNSYR